MATPSERITNVQCTEDSLVVELADRRSISAPLGWYYVGGSVTLVCGRAHCELQGASGQCFSSGS